MGAGVSADGHSKDQVHACTRTNTPSLIFQSAAGRTCSQTPGLSVVLLFAFCMLVHMIHVCVSVSVCCTGSPTRSFPEHADVVQLQERFEQYSVIRIIHAEISYSTHFLNYQKQVRLIKADCRFQFLILEDRPGSPLFSVDLMVPFVFRIQTFSLPLF